MKYTQDQKLEAATLAGEIGITAAMRQLGFPSNFVILRKWCDELGIKPEVDLLKSKARATRDWYEDEELIIVNQLVISKSYELMQAPNVSASELKALSEAIKKAGEQIRTIQGKHTQHETTQLDKNIEELLKSFEAQRAAE